MKRLELDQLLTARCYDVGSDVKWHEMRAQILHHVVHRRLACIVHEAWCEPREPTNASNRDDLTRWLALFTSLVASVEQLKEGYARGEDRCHIRFERVHPYVHWPIVEVVLSELCYSRLRTWQWASVWRLVDGCHAGIVDKQINVSGVLSDLVHDPLEIFM